MKEFLQKSLKQYKINVSSNYKRNFLESISVGITKKHLKEVLNELYQKTLTGFLNKYLKDLLNEILRKFLMNFKKKFLVESLKESHAEPLK